MTEIHVPRWWMGGVASAAAACFTQPLDTIKVNSSFLKTTWKHTETVQSADFIYLRMLQYEASLVALKVCRMTKLHNFSAS